MRINLRRKPREGVDWREWFAWHPIHLGFGVFVWLEQVERRGYWRLVADCDGMPVRQWFWRYRSLTTPQK